MNSRTSIFFNRAKGCLSNVASCIALPIAIVFSSVSCGTFRHGEKSLTQSTSLVQSIDVALYPYVPNLEYFQETISDSWSQIPGAPTLNFVSWDCYSEDPPASVEVFVYDSIFLSYFASEGFLRPFGSEEISNITDFLPYAITGCLYDSEYYSIPQIGCTDILYYRDGDQEMATVSDLTGLWNLLGPAEYSTSQPPNGIGFMMDFSGGTTDACTYIATQQSLSNTYSTTPYLPDASNLDPSVMNNLGLMINMAGLQQASYSEQQPYQRATWFDDGSARAMVGFTEAMSAMPTNQNTVQFKQMPLADNASFSLFYVDVVGVNSNVIDTPDETWAVQLANLLASNHILVEAFSVEGNPQFLMPVRNSVFQSLGSEFSQYENMYSLVQSLNPKAFRLGTTSRPWLEANKNSIRQQILAQAGNSAPLSEAETKGKAR